MRDFPFVFFERSFLCAREKLNAANVNFCVVFFGFHNIFYIFFVQAELVTAC